MWTPARRAASLPAVSTGPRHPARRPDGRAIAAETARATNPARVERAPWRTPAERERFIAALDRARAVYQKSADESAP